MRAIRMDCDLYSIQDPYEYFHNPDALLHLAWRDGFIHYSINHINDLPRHYQFLKLMIDSRIPKISIMGSMHEIGFFEGSVNEDTPCNPMSFYGVSKNTLRQCSEILVKEGITQLQWLRGYYIVGNTKYGSSVFSKISIAESEGRKEFPFTMGLNQFDFLDYNRFCEMTSAAVCQNKINGIINICSGRPEKIADRVERYIAENKYSIKLKYGAFPDRPYDSVAIWGDNKKINSILNSCKNCE